MQATSIDSVSGLLTARTFRETFESVAVARAAGGDAFVLALIDVDCFGNLTDAIGPEAAEAVLRQVADVIRRCAPTLAAGRLGVDRFALALGSLKCEALARAENLRAAIADARFFADRIVRLTAAGGVAGSPEDGESAADLFAAAEGALRAAKRAGGNAMRAAGSFASVEKSAP